MKRCAIVVIGCVLCLVVAAGIVRSQEKMQLVAQPKKIAAEDIISLELEAAPLREVLAAIAEQTELNYVCRDDILEEVTVTVFVKDVSAKEAIEAIAYATHHEVKYFQDGKIMAIAKPGFAPLQPAPMKLRVLRPQER